MDMNTTNKKIEKMLEAGQMPEILAIMSRYIETNFEDDTLLGMSLDMLRHYVEGWDTSSKRK